MGYTHAQFVIVPANQKIRRGGAAREQESKRMNFGRGGYQSVEYGGGMGGGYMPSTQGGGFGSPSVGQSPGMDGRKKSTKTQSVRPLSSALLETAQNPIGDEPFKIDGEDVGQITLVGEIIEVNEMATNIVYKIDDRTGPIIEVRRWVDDEESPMELQRRAACREGIYVKIVGHLRLFNKQRSVIGFYIKPIEDFNEVTHHLAETIFGHLALTKGIPLPKEFTELQQMDTSGYGGGGTWNPMATSTQVGRTPYGGGARVDSGLDSVQKQVLSIISQSRSEQGVHIREVITVAKRNGFNDQNIKNAVDFLSNEGHIYSTIDDEHYKSTEEF